MGRTLRDGWYEFRRRHPNYWKYALAMILLLAVLVVLVRLPAKMQFEQPCFNHRDGAMITHTWKNDFEEANVTVTVDGWYIQNPLNTDRPFGSVLQFLTSVRKLQWVGTLMSPILTDSDWFFGSVQLSNSDLCYQSKGHSAVHVYAVDGTEDLYKMNLSDQTHEGNLNGQISVDFKKDSSLFIVSVYDKVSGSHNETYTKGTTYIAADDARNAALDWNYMNSNDDTGN